ncbi:MAG: HAMP domain-containing histidine kinase [Lachnospiraceae bacterium]|nr:HAMP domain-containing histidine kinase [Lachnospiraceae bacterium]
MSKKAFYITIIISFVIELLLAVLLIGKIENAGQDPVRINDCLKDVANNFGDEEKYPEGLSYAILDNDGNPVYKSGDGVSQSQNEAVKNGDIMLDIKKDGELLGKLVLKNTMRDEISKYKKRLFTSVAVISAIQLLILLSFFIYLRKTVIKPFEKMNSFAARIAQGNLDTPLELDRKHIFGSFTEAFDLMRSELRKARAAEKKANDDKKEMVAKLSHDIKTPVASIKSTSELGYELAGSEKIKEKFNQINIKSDQVTALVSNLFNSSINDISEIEVNPFSQPSSLVKELIQNADYRNRASSFEIPECRVYIDRLRLLQAFDNIFMNSYKYGDTDIDVKAFTEQDSLVIFIADHGPGVSDAELPLLKEKYKRGNNTEGKDGAGLGLYLTNYYIEKMNGRLELMNLEPGFGVKIYLRISE